MREPKKFLIGDTLKVSWINSGNTPTPIFAAIYNGSDTLVNSISMTDSGNGHYYSYWTLPNSIGYYVAETIATIGGQPFKRRAPFKAVKGEVD